MLAPVCTFSPHCRWVQVLRDGSEVAHPGLACWSARKLPARSSNLSRRKVK